MEIREAAEVYRLATKGLRLLGQLTPISVEEDRRQLLKYATDGRQRKLVWCVTPDAERISQLLQAATVIRRHGGEIAYAEALESSIQGLEAALSGDVQGFGDWSRHRYGAPSTQLYMKAADAISVPRSVEPSRPLSSVDVADLAQDVLDRYQLDEWSAEVKDGLGARMMVSGRTVIVRAGENFSYDEARRLMVHEIGTHTLRRANADQQPLGLARNCPFGDAWTEEGLAVYQEHARGVSMSETLRVYGARVLAVTSAQSHGIYYCLDELLSHGIEPQFAVDICIRAKRGYHDPKSAGAFTKDLAYLGGFLEIEEWAARDSRIVSDLMASKWPLARISDIRACLARGEMLPATYLPDERLTI